MDSYGGSSGNVAWTPSAAKASGKVPGRARLKALAAASSAFNGSQPAANPPPCLPNPAGCLLSEGERYALEQAQDGPPEVIAYADRRGV